MGVLDGVQGARGRGTGLRAVGGGDPRRLGRRRRQGRATDGRSAPALREVGCRPGRRGLQHPLRAVQPQQAQRRDRPAQRRRPRRARRAHRVGRRVHHELPAVGAREVAAAHRRHLGGQPALRLRDRVGPGPRGSRRRARAGSTRCRSGRAVGSATSSRRRARRSSCRAARSATRRAARSSPAASRPRW